MNVEEISKTITEYCPANSDVFQDAWLHILETSPEDMHQLYRSIRKARNKQIKEYHVRLTTIAFGIPMVGSVQAGWPSPEEEALCDIVSIDEYLITRPDSSFLVKVSGDSMTGAGIMDGDLVIVEKGRNPKNGDIVLAEVDGEWTMKYFRRKGKEVVLEAANEKYPTIRAKTELRLGGVITAVVRKYHL